MDNIRELIAAHSEVKREISEAISADNIDVVKEKDPILSRLFEELLAADPVCTQDKVLRSQYLIEIAFDKSELTNSQNDVLKLLLDELNTSETSAEAIRS